jgi:perosamine synthetase
MVTTFPSAPQRTLPSDQDASGRTLGEEEIAAVSAALRSGVLTSTKGTFVAALETRFARMMGMKHAFACSSGTAALHCAVAALDPEPGDEIITTPITDMGALTPILYQGAIPVFADVDPLTCNVTPETIEAQIGERTKAIVVTHLFGNPCDIDGIVALANRRGIPVIEDCAQAFLAAYKGNFVGTVGKIGCYSLQQGKHITTGEGGIVVTNDDDLARRIYLFINKAWGYGDPHPDHYFLALNYRMSELVGSVGCAQLQKLPTVVARRRMLAELMTDRLRGVDAISPPAILPGAQHSYWKYCIRTSERLPAETVVELAGLLKQQGIVSAPRYIQKPAFMCEVFQKRKTFGTSGYPFTLARPEVLDYRIERYPGAAAALERVLVVPWNDRYDEEDVAYIANAMCEAAAALAESHRP